MDRKNKTVPAASLLLSSQKSVSCKSEENKENDTAAGFPPIDFTSPEFNIMDELDDNTGNYRDFQKLDNIMTADMRHQEARKSSNTDAGKTFGDQRGKDRSEPVVSNEEKSPIDTSPVTVTSRGRTLIIETDPGRAGALAAHLTGRGLACTVCLVADHDTNIPPVGAGRQQFLLADAVSVQGGFGGFTAMAAGNGSRAEPVRLQDHKTSFFDLVLDMQPIPSFDGQQLPLGYYAPGDDRVLLDEALAELPEMKGLFTKPRFTVFQQELCLRGRSRSHTCERCQNACPMGAVSPEKNGISLDPYLCQGCGSCALVCPADAIHMIKPSREELLTCIRDLLAGHREKTDFPPVLIIHGCEIHPKDLPAMSGDRAYPDPLFFEVEEIGRIGYETMLAALAYGAGSVILACGKSSAPETLQALEQQRQITAAVLQALKMPENRISLLVVSSRMIGGEDAGPGTSLNGTLLSAPLAPPALCSHVHGRRALTRLAVRHLAKLSASSPESISLPDGAPFGCVTLDKAACTLCMACASICPTGALSAGGDKPRLSFNENDCHQCGLCIAACPETALQLQPRLLCTGNEDDPPEVLQEAEPFTCIECGVPFASKAMIDRLQDKLAGHWMYGNDRQLRRLQMCRTCSTQDALLAKDFQ